MHFAARSALILLASMLATASTSGTVEASDDELRAVTIARATEIPACGVFVDAASAEDEDGSAERPYRTIGAALSAAAPASIVCVAEGTYAEELRPGDKPFVLAGGFQSGSGFKVRDSSLHVSKAQGKGGSFVRIEDPAPKGDELVAIDGFEITGYAQAILREHWESQRFEITNNLIHGNTCADASLAGGGFALVNVSGTVRGNVIRNNSCGRGGAGFLNDSANQNTVLIAGNLVEGNSGTEPSTSHGGGLYLFGNTLQISGNLIVGNSVTGWGGGLFVGAFTPGNQPTTAMLSRNVYRGNRAGDAGGGFFCDDGATCIASYEIYERNCGGNILLDGGSEGSGPTVTRFDHITNVGALDLQCSGPGAGVVIDTNAAVAPDSHAFTDSIFWGNAERADFATACTARCDALKLSVDRSMVETRYEDGSVRIDFGPENIAPADPLFVAPDDGDFRLQPGSPAIGMGALGDGGPVAPAGDTSAVSGDEPAAADGDRVTGKTANAVTRGALYMGFAEAFNRYYTDPLWKPSRILYVAPDGNGDGATREAAMAARDAVAVAGPGTLIHFLAGNYEGGLELTKETGGTYEEPVVFYGERNPDGSPGVIIDCAVGKRQACINLEGADNVAVDGFEFVGGRHGVRSVGLGYRASEHARGVAILNSIGHDQENDPFFSGQSDWAVWEGNTAYGAGEGDGHGLYISNGSDWNIVRLNETYANHSSDFQINASPNETCGEEGLALDDPVCDAYAGEGEGGQGASDYFLVERNHFHDGFGPGPNFTSVRRSVIRNNIFGPQVRHNVSFWQETDNPKLGSRENKILHNLFITTGRHGVQFVAHSTGNEFANNILLGIRLDDGVPAANPEALLMEVDGTTAENVFQANIYIAGRIEGRDLSLGETAVSDFSIQWFRQFPATASHDPADFTPTREAPFLRLGSLLPDAPVDMRGVARSGRVDLGPIEAP